MSEEPVTSNAIHEHAEQALADAHLQEAYRSSTLRLYSHRLQAITEVPGWQRLRDRAQALKREVMQNLDFYLMQFADRVEQNGGKVHWAATAEEACTIVRKIAEQSGANEIVKGKTMVSEEIELNHALEAAGIRPFETDLGEFIVQMAGDRPAHIVAPAIHKTRHDVSNLFERNLHSEPTEVPEQLTAIARRALREKFASASMGLSGANFAVAETGTIVTIENEGNIRMCTTSPRVHVALAGIEKLIPRFADLAVFLRLLGRSGTGQKLTVYTSLLTGPRRPGEDGPEEMHVVLVDNGRIATLADEKMREVLHCIRCGACLNTCPVYRKIGGHAYGWVYSGPIGALVTPQLAGIEKARELPFASSLCGACRDVCPVKINIPDLLLHLRSEAQEKAPVSKPSGAPLSERTSMRLWAWAMQRPWAYALGARLARLGQRFVARQGWIRKAPMFPASRWTQGRDLPGLAPKSFRERWKEISDK
ncbi:MAG: LutB/LldF family L-lactate oxidation iron-sulfur protein [Terriglobia bacterium]